MAVTSTSPVLRADDTTEQKLLRVNRTHLEVFGEACTLKEIFDLDDRWTRLTGTQRRRILHEVTRNYAVAINQEPIPLLEQHILQKGDWGRFPLSIPQAWELVQILREEDQSKYL